MTELATFTPLLPEIAIAVAAMGLLMLGAFGDDTPEAGVRVGWLAIAALAGAGVPLAMQPAETVRLFEGAFVGDAFGRFAKALILIGSAVSLLLSFGYLKAARIMKFEIPVLVLLAAAGMMVMVSAGDLIALYLGLEMQSLALYVLAAVRRDQLRSSEAGLKYFVLGALSSGMLLYGASLIYGFTGSVSFEAIAAQARSVAPADNLGLVFGLVFLLVGLAFKVSAVPFHMWTPDVYEGAPTPVTAFFAAAPKVAALALLTRVLAEAFPGIVSQWQQIIVFLAIASMLLGSFAAIGQTNIKRLMAYSSIGHVGFALVGLAAGTGEGVSALLIYLAIYLAMTLGVFAAILAMRRKDEMVEDIDELSGLARTDLGLAFMLGALMFSLAGIPVLAGFFAKWYVFLAAVKAGLYPLAVIGVLASVVAAFYYLRIVKIMFFDEPREKFRATEPWTRAVLVAATVFVIAFAVYPSLIVDAAAHAASSLKL